MKKIILIIILLIPILCWGEITQISSFEHDAGSGQDNSLIQIDATHYMLAYRGVDAWTAVLKTFSIDGSYNITMIDTLEHDGECGYDNSLVKIDDIHFILAYAGTDYDGYIKTFSIDGNYNITAIDTLEHDGVQGTYNSLVKIDDTHFILAYQGSGLDGYLSTFSIDGSYNITEIANLEHDTDKGYYNSLVKIDATHFMLAYMGTDNDGFVKTFSIDGSYGNITAIDTLEHSLTNGSYSSLVQVDATHYFLAYYDALASFSIDGSYAITEIDDLYLGQARYTNVVIMDDIKHFFLAYNTTTACSIKTYSIDVNYDNITVIDVLQHEAVVGDYHNLVRIDATHYMLAYSDGAADGRLKVFAAPSYASSGWEGKIGGITNPEKVGGVEKANIKSIGGVE